MRKRCKWIGSFTDLSKHIKDTCEFAIATCGRCRVNYLRTEGKFHEKDCAWNVLPCKKCQSPVPAWLSFTHTNECKIKQCRFHKVGCAFNGDKTQMTTHLLDNRFNHLEMMEDFISDRPSLKDQIF